jgi:hypothetical protein
MSACQKEKLVKIATTDDLHISPLRDDGRTYGTPTWIWSVVVDDELYVRAYNGQKSRWYQAALRQKAGRITAAGMTIDVTFEPVENRRRKAQQSGLQAPCGLTHFSQHPILRWFP